MAATTTEHFIYPPDFQHGDYVDSGLGPRRYCVQLSGEATATEDEDGVVKIAIGDLVNQRGVTATKFVIEKVEYDILGFTGVILSFDRDVEDRFFIMGSTTGKQDYTLFGGRTDNGDGGTGNLLLTTEGGAQYDTYSITLTLRAK